MDGQVLSFWDCPFNGNVLYSGMALGQVLQLNYFVQSSLKEKLLRLSWCGNWFFDITIWYDMIWCNSSILKRTRSFFLQIWLSMSIVKESKKNNNDYNFHSKSLTFIQKLLNLFFLRLIWIFLTKCNGLIFLLTDPDSQVLKSRIPTL